MVEEVRPGGPAPPGRAARNGHPREAGPPDRAESLPCDPGPGQTRCPYATSASRSMRGETGRPPAASPPASESPTRCCPCRRALRRCLARAGGDPVGASGRTASVDRDQPRASISLRHDTDLRRGRLVAAFAALLSAPACVIDVAVATDTSSPIGASASRKSNRRAPLIRAGIASASRAASGRQKRPPRPRHDAAPEAVEHADRAVDQVAEIVARSVL